MRRQVISVLQEREKRIHMKVFAKFIPFVLHKKASAKKPRLRQAENHCVLFAQCTQKSKFLIPKL